MHRCIQCKSHAIIYIDDGNGSCKATKKVQSRLKGTDEKERAQQKARKSTLFIRKILVTH